MKIDWTSSDSDVLLNPAYAQEDQQKYRQILSFAHAWPAHIWLATSGSINLKWVGVSKEALLASAQAINQHIDSSSSDRWVLALPSFHVGGLGVWARSYLSGAALLNFNSYFPKWQADAFHRFLQTTQGTLTSLVPAQLYDLIQLRVKAPPSLRAVIIGGGRLLPELYQKGIELGWPLLPSYGLTECASQVATAPLDCWREEGFPPLKILPHVEVRAQEGRLAFKGASLFSAYAYFEGTHLRFFDPKIDGWFIGEDRGEVQGLSLTIWGRTDAVIKVGGENVDLARLESRLQAICLRLGIKHEMTLVAMPDARLGHAVHLAAANCPASICVSIIEQFSQTVLPFERIRCVHHLPFIPRSALSKVLKGELMELIKAASLRSCA